MSAKAARVRLALDLLKRSFPAKDIAQRVRVEYSVSERTARGDVQDARAQLEKELWSEESDSDPLDPGQTRWEFLRAHRERAAKYRAEADAALRAVQPAHRAEACKYERVALQYDQTAIRLLGLDRRLPEDELSDETDCQRALVNAIRRSIGQWDAQNARDLLDVVLEHVRALDIPAPTAPTDAHGGVLRYI